MTTAGTTSAGGGPHPAGTAEQLVDLHATALLRLARALCLSGSPDAEEVVVDVIVTAAASSPPLTDPRHLRCQLARMVCLRCRAHDSHTSREAVLWLCLDGGMGIGEAASVTGLSRNRVALMLHRALTEAGSRLSPGTGRHG